MNTAKDRHLEIATENGIMVTSDITDKTMQFLATSSGGMLLEDIGEKLTKALLTMADDEDVDKASLTIKLDFKKSKDHSQLFSSKAQVKLNIPAKKYDDSFFANADGTPSRDLDKQTLHHTKMR